MNIFKKISPVYALQVLAVILLFAYKRPMPETSSGESLPHKILMRDTKDQALIRTWFDASLTGEVNNLSILNIGLKILPQLPQNK